MMKAQERERSALRCSPKKMWGAVAVGVSAWGMPEGKIKASAAVRAAEACVEEARRGRYATSGNVAAAVMSIHSPLRIS